MKPNYPSKGHPGQTANILMGDGHVTGLTYDEYLARSDHGDAKSDFRNPLQ